MNDNTPFFQNSDMLVRPVFGSSTRVSWFPMAATRCSTEDTNPLEQSSDTPDSAHSLHCRWCVRDKDNETEVFVLSSRPADCESAARQHSCWLSICPSETLSIFFSFTCSVSLSASGSNCSRSVFSMLLVESLFWGRGLCLYICSSSNWSMKIRTSNSLFYLALSFLHFTLSPEMKIMYDGEEVLFVSFHINFSDLIHLFCSGGHQAERGQLHWHTKLH